MFKVSVTRDAEFWYNLLQKKNIKHLYPDRDKILNNKLVKKSASIEGNTNLDAMIKFKEKGCERTKFLFIEAKYLSDIDTKTTYNAFRNQIIRNLDAMIDFPSVKENEERNIEFPDLYFALLTPKIFRTVHYGDNKKGKFDEFDAQQSRFYCYIMNEYRSVDSLKRDLPHRRSNCNIDFNVLESNIGWITFDDMYYSAQKHNTITSNIDEFEVFFSQRGLT